MSIKTSYSQNSTYKACPKHWEFKYIQKFDATTGEGSSLHFGSAIDDAVMAMIEGKKDWMETFNNRWNTANSGGKVVQIFDSNVVNYAYNDFDADVLTPADLATMAGWAKELGLSSSTPTSETTVSTETAIATFKDVLSRKKNPYKAISPNQLRYFNRCCWLSLKRKGELMLSAFHTEFYPNITKVHSTQEWGQVVDETTGDRVGGKLDMVLSYKGYNKPIIFDLKTAGRPYTEEQLELTEQLTLYAAMVGHKYNTDLVGYVVLCKQMNKEEIDYCEQCGKVRDTRAKTCDGTINGKRCGAEWKHKKKIKGTVQVMIQQKSQKQIDDLLIDYSNVILGMASKVVYKNTNKCSDWYGSRCAYYDACHNDDYKDLKKRE